MGDTSKIFFLNTQNKSMHYDYLFSLSIVFVSEAQSFDYRIWNLPHKYQRTILIIPSLNKFIPLNCLYLRITITYSWNGGGRYGKVTALNWQNIFGSILEVLGSKRGQRTMFYAGNWESQKLHNIVSKWKLLKIAHLLSGSAWQDHTPSHRRSRSPESDESRLSQIFTARQFSSAQSSVSLEVARTCSDHPSVSCRRAVIERGRMSLLLWRSVTCEIKIKQK